MPDEPNDEAVVIGEKRTEYCCRFAPSGSALPEGCEVCIHCGHRITPGYRCHGCGRTRLQRTATITAHHPGTTHGVECHEAWRDLRDCPHEVVRPLRACSLHHAGPCPQEDQP